MRWVVVLVLLQIGVVDPAEGVHEHVVESGSDVAHQGHEEKGDLEDVVLDEIETVDEAVIPGDGVEVDEEGEEP